MSEDRIKIGFLLKDLRSYNAHVKRFVDSGKFECTIFYTSKISNIGYQFGIIPENVSMNDIGGPGDINKYFDNLFLDCFIIFSPGHLLDQAVLLLCKQKGILTIYYQHGVNPDFKANRRYLKKFSVHKFASLIRIYPVFIIIYIQTMIRSTIKNKYKVLTKRFFGLLSMDSNIKNGKFGYKELHADYCFVYSLQDKENLLEHLDIQSDNVILMGYPFSSVPVFSDVKEDAYLLYVSSALRASGIINCTLGEELEMYHELIRQVHAVGKKIKIKLHPYDDSINIQQKLSLIPDVTVEITADVEMLIYGSQAVIGDMSSALLYAIRSYKPIFIIRNKSIDQYPFEFKNVKIGTHVLLENLSTMLDDLDLSAEMRKSYTDYLNSTGIFLDKPHEEIVYRFLESNINLTTRNSN